MGVAAADPPPAAERFFVAGPPAAPDARRLRAGALPEASVAPRDAALLRPGPLVFLRSSRSAASFSSFSFSTSRISVSHRRASSFIMRTAHNLQLIGFVHLAPFTASSNTI